MKKNQPAFFWSFVFATSMFFGLAHGQIAGARTIVTDWYVQDFDSKIVVNPDSTLDITETIVADCGNLSGKHGIFRILPTAVKIGDRKVKMPVELASITDASGRKYKYSETKNRKDDTVTWKIGDPNVTVQGVSTYVIRYSVKNVMRFDNPNFDEFYWNLSGNFWEMEIDRFHASIEFPSQISQANATVEYYAGNLGEQGKESATYRWSAPNVLEFDSTEKIGRIEGRRVPQGLPLIFLKGITASVTFPKNIIAPYQLTFWEKYAEYSYLLIPIMIFIICFALWKKYGDDPEMDKTVIAEYSAPGDLSPIEMGTLMRNGAFDSKFVTAEMIWFATKGLLAIKETENKILFFSSKDYELTRKHNPEVEKTLNDAQQKILAAIFLEGETVALSSLKNKFHKNIDKIRDAAKNNLKAKGLIQTAGISIGNVMKGLAPFLLWGAFASIERTPFLAVGVGISALIILGFGFIMPKRTLAGTELNWKIKGFKLFMETVDKDRAPFYEKENIFEKCLPYAILFGMTKEWISRMRDIYGADFYATHAPAWYLGSMGSFDADSFSSNLDSLSSAISSNTSSPSGSGGSGSSGGGGGGGGGGGW